LTSRTVEIGNPSGLHARPAAAFVATAQRFESSVAICRSCEPGRKVDAKSILSVLSLGLSAGTGVTLECWGPDEDDAVSILSDMLKAQVY
jgi:phosphotransferase system HPr (HPr) family protein